MTEPAAPDQSRAGNDQRKGLFIEAEAVFHGQVIGYQENKVQLPPAPSPIPLADAQALLAELPLDHVPQPQTLPQPHRMRSWAPNKLFVGRDDDLGRIAAQLKAGGTIAVTTGIGGVGKTQLAIEAAHRYGRYFGGGVFWLSFADPSGITAEIADCGRAMRAFHDAEQLDLDTQVQRTQALWANDLPRLLIFDNCEDEALLRQRRPTTGGCRVLVTSRKQTAWSPDLRITLMPLEVLARAASVQLLQQLAPRLTVEEADQIAQELGDLPLALHLAGSYLAFYDDITAEQYLVKLRAINPLTHWSLQGDGVESMPTDREPHVERAFALSFERLKPGLLIDARARVLLARAACFAPGELFAHDWLAATLEVEGDEEERARAGTGAIKRLLSLGLLEPVGKEVRLHRLVAAYTRLAMQDEGALPAVEQVVGLLAVQANMTYLPLVMQPVLPHLRYLVQQGLVARRADASIAHLCNSLASALQRASRYDEALPFFQQALAIREQVLGLEHPLTAESVNNLGGLYWLQGDYSQAEARFEQALQMRMRVLGPDHPYTNESLINLGSAYRRRGDHAAAKLLFERALAVFKQRLGPEHRFTVSALNALASVHEAQGNYAQAQPLIERALAVRQRVLGPEHPDTAVSLSNLATIRLAQGDEQAAQELFERALPVFEQSLGQHPDTATALANLAAIFEKQGDYARAVPLRERALQIRERVFGPEHPEIVTTLNNLAVAYIRQERYTEAVPLMERAVHICQTKLGPQHPHTQVAQENLLVVYRQVVLATVPEPVRAAYQAKDAFLLQEALQELPAEDAQAILEDMIGFGLLPPPDFRVILAQGIVEGVQRSGGPRAEVEAVIRQLEEQGNNLATAVRAIWAGQRDSAALTAGLDDADAELIRHVLVLLGPPTT